MEWTKNGTISPFVLTLELSIWNPWKNLYLRLKTFFKIIRENKFKEKEFPFKKAFINMC